MKIKTVKKLKEGFNPAAAGSKAARMDDRARRDKNVPFAYYSEEFYALEEIRQSLLGLSSKWREKEYGGPYFKKAAILVEKAQNEMLKAGR